MRADSLICDRCGAQLQMSSDDGFAKHVRVSAKQWAKDAGELDLCPTCWDVVIRENRRWLAEVTWSRREPETLDLGEETQ